MSVKTDWGGGGRVVQVIKEGAACHTGAESGFFGLLYEDETKQRFTLEALYDLIMGRKDSMQEGSYTSYWVRKGREKIVKKVGEESTEVVIAAMKKDDGETVVEISDV